VRSQPSWACTSSVTTPPPIGPRGSSGGCFASARAAARHPDRQFLAEPGRALHRRADHPSGRAAGAITASRRWSSRPATGSPPGMPIRGRSCDQDRRRDPRHHRHLLPPHQQLRTPIRRHQTDLACSWWIPRRSKRIQEGSRRIVRMIRRMIRGTSDRGSETRQANHPSRPGLPAGRDGGVAGDESTCSPASAGAHRSASNCMDCSWSAAFACCFHRSWSMPTTRSHRHSAPSPMRAGSWIQGTSWAAAPGARMSVKL
jgi:hypothetical protein